MKHLATTALLFGALFLMGTTVSCTKEAVQAPATPGRPYHITATSCNANPVEYDYFLITSHAGQRDTIEFATGEASLELAVGDTVWADASLAAANGREWCMEVRSNGYVLLYIRSCTAPPVSNAYAVIQ